MAEVAKTKEWKDWAAGKGKWTTWSLPVFNMVDCTWIVWKPDSNDWMIVPDTEYRQWWDERPKMFKTRYDKE